MSSDKDPAMSSNRSPRWAFMQTFDIPDWDDPEKVYLRRLRLIQTPLFGIYLHWIFLPDADRDPHDHPWPFVSFVLRGGYDAVEHPDPSRDLTRVESHTARRWSVHRLNTTTAHRITNIRPGTMTLVAVGRRCKSWGFYTGDGFVDWVEYEHGAGPDPFDGPPVSAGSSLPKETPK